jgi:hypothetical protein
MKYVASLSGVHRKHFRVLTHVEAVTGAPRKVEYLPITQVGPVTDLGVA